MNFAHLVILQKAIDKALEQISTDGNPYFVYEDLSKDMTTAAAGIYDACMRGQEFMKDEMS